MKFQLTFYIVSLFVTLVLSGFLAYFAWRNRHTVGARPYAGSAFAECILAFTEIMSVIAPSSSQALFWFQLRYASNAALSIFWLVFALEYSGMKSWLSKRFLAGLLIIPIVTQVMLWSNDLHLLWLRQEATLNQVGIFWVADITTRKLGPGFSLHMIYSLLLVICGISLMLFTAWKMRNRLRRQAVLLAGAGLTTFIFAVNAIVNFLPKTDFNPFTPGIGLSLVLIAFAIFRFDFLKRGPGEDADLKISSFGPAEKRSLAGLIALFLLFTFGVAVVGYTTYKNYENQFRTRVEEQLSSTAKLKADGLTNWRSQQLGAAEIIGNNPTFAMLTQRFLEDPADSEAKVQLRAWLDVIQTSYHYERVFLMDATSTVRLSSPPGPVLVDSHIFKDTPAVLESGKVTFLDFHRHSLNREIHIGILVPVYADRRPLGVVMFWIDPDDYLYPMLQQWPIPSQSAESLLVRREGSNVLFLNNPKFQQDAALNLRFPLNNESLPAAKAARGETGIVEGKDYRGIQVIADIRPVPDSPWFLVSKMDTDEVYAPLRERLRQTILFFSILTLAGATVMVLLWRQLQIRHFHSELESMNALRASEEKFRLAFDTSPDAIAITRMSDGTYIAVNKGFERTTGYTREQVVGKTSSEINIWKYPKDREKIVSELVSKGQVQSSETTFLTRNGEIFGQMSATILQLNGVPHILNITRDVTEQRRMEEAFEVERKLMEALMENVPVQIYFKDLQSRFIRVNQAQSQLFGLSDPSQAIGKTDSDFFSQEHARQAFEDEQEIIRTGTTINKEEKETWVDRPDRWISTTKLPLRDKDGNIIGTFGVSMNITERKQAEDELRESEERFSKAFYSSPVPQSIIAQQTSRIMEVNDANCRLFGYSREELIDTATPKLDLWQDPVERQSAMEELQKTGRLRPRETNVRVKSGLIHTLIAAIEPISWKGVPCFIVSMIDITERKKAEKELRLKDELLHLTSEMAKIGGWEFDTLTHEGTWTDEVAHIHDLDPAIPTNAEFGISFYLPDSRKKIEQAIQEAIESAKGYDLELQMITATGNQKWVRTMGLPILDGGKVVKLRGIFQDITERKKTEDALQNYNTRLEAEVEQRTHELREVQEQLVRQERLATLGQVAGSIGHELRNPLGIIANAIYFLKISEPNANDKVKEYLDIIEKETRTSDKIITDLLDFTRIKSIDLQPASVSKLICQSLERFPAPQSIEVTLNIPEDMPQVFVDPQHMIQVFTNLISNACQSMVPVNSTSKALNVGKLTVSASALGDMIKIEVQDTGTGISPENMKKLFEPLFTTKTKGIGLGLAVSRKLIEANKGRIEAQSELGKGSIFTVFLPMYSQEAK